MKSFLIFLLTCFILQANGQSDSVIEVHKIGDHFGGGIIFYLDETGQHGLIAAPYDQTTKKVMWGLWGKTFAQSPIDGESNTKKILDYFKSDKLYTGQPYKKTAAYICDTLELENYSDWYLPALNELRKMYDTQEIIGNFLLGDYCSSSEYGKNDAYFIHFRLHDKIAFYYNKDNKRYFVRCIRKF